ncbi:unnamed protein product [Dibothriocephalus latus]|uniref:Uncharacterized protein n=1 Tax=Dibothriocephalus latus TaxID=60516 RepID=A0A3P7QMB5_DIBLA|nr:unnamed protein product [Dibothriocephalus latus]
MPIKRSYATAIVADWVVVGDVQYLHRATIIFGSDGEMKEKKLVVSFLIHLKLYVQEDATEVFFKRERLIPFDDDEGIIHIPRPKFRSAVFEDQRL